MAAADLAAVSDGTASWTPVVAGALIALAFHALKALARPVLNTLTFGAAGPAVSTAEDFASTVMAVLAIVVPVLVLVFVPLLIGILLWARQRGRRAKAERGQRGPDHTPRPPGAGSG